jgi:hypothetical protein
VKRILLVAVVTVVVGLAAVGTAAAWDKPAPPVTQAIDQGQGNTSSQSQVQIVPIAPQVNVQNVNVLTGGDVDQGDANNANTGQANQQQNTQIAVQKDGGDPSGSQSQAVDQGQGNHSSQGQVQIVPIAPQANVQNVNVGTYGDVHQGDANNANTGQANQQHNTQVAAQSSGGSSHGGCNCSSSSEPADPSISQHQGNSSAQKQIQIVPIAPQANVQNVNVLAFGDVRQGDANNANTGQANQQENTQVAVQKNGRGWNKTCGCKWPTSADEQSVAQKQGNWSAQKQLQIVPVAPQLNLQNVNLLTKGDVRQDDVNNANTGQANQQSGTQVAVQKAGHGPTTCGCTPPPRKCGCALPPPKCGCAPPPPKCDCAPPPTCNCTSPSSSGGQSISQKQGNRSYQKQVQILPVAPQLNAQNVNLLTWGGVSQGDANNANTGQANQQDNTQLAFQRGGWSIA